MIIDAICFALSRYFMKLSDELTDEQNNLPLAIITGILCVIFTVYVSINNGDAACIFISILIGTALAYKVDSGNHIINFGSSTFQLVMFVIMCNSSLY